MSLTTLCIDGGDFHTKLFRVTFFEPLVLLILDNRGFARRFDFPEIAAIVGQAKAGERQGQNETEKAKQLAPDRNGQQDDGRRTPMASPWKRDTSTVS